MATDIQLERARYQIEGETDPHQCFDIHHELFGVYPDVTIVKMREGGYPPLRGGAQGNRARLAFDARRM